MGDPNQRCINGTGCSRQLWRILSPSASSAPSGENTLTTSSCSTNAISGTCCAPTSLITTPRVPIRRSATTVPIYEKSSRRRAGASWRSQGSAAFITATSAPPDFREIHPSPGASRATALLIPRRQELLSLLKIAFAQRRKRLMKNLEAGFSREKLMSAFASVDLEVDSRAEQLTPEQFVQLLTAVSESKH